MLSVLYDGRWRDFEPYLYGRLTSGRDVLFGWQASGPHAGWRILYLHRMARFITTHQTFEASRPDYDLVRPASLVAVYAEGTGSAA